MNKSDFKINEVFYTGAGKWICTDVGTRAILAIKYDEFIDLDKGNKSGPPYSIAESVFDEYDFDGCRKEMK